MQTKQNDNDESRVPKLVQDGQREARRLENEMLPTLHEELQPLAKQVLQIGLEIKKELSNVRALKAQYWNDYEQNRHQAYKKFHNAITQLEQDWKQHNDVGGCYLPGALRDAFVRYQKIAKQHETIDTKVDQSAIAQRLDKLMEMKYIPTVLELDEKAQQLKALRIPWEIRYFASLEMDPVMEKMTVAVFIGHDPQQQHHDSSNTTSSLDDQCFVCHKIIPAPQKRVRSFESSSRKALSCNECHQMIQQVDCMISKNLTGRDLDLAKQELLEIWPHYGDHMLVTEHDSPFGLRREAMGLANHRARDEKKGTTLRKLLPHFFHKAYRNRPLFGMPQEQEEESLDDEEAQSHERNTKAQSDQSYISLYRHKKIPYHWFTYQEVWQVISILSKEMMPLLPPVQQISEGDNLDEPPSGSLQPEIGILSSPTPIFFAIQMACIMLGRISVAMDTSWNASIVWRALENSKVSTLLVDAQGYQMLKKIYTNNKGLPSCIQKVVVIATDPFQPNKNLERIDQVRESFADKLMLDASSWWEEGLALQTIEAIDSFTFGNQFLPTDHYLFGLFSSGTSGTGGHKGVLVRERTFRETSTSANFDHPLVACLTSSPSWASGNDIVWQTALAGGRIGFVTARSRRSSSIWSHLYSVKPTWRLSFVPALVTDLIEEYSQAFDFFQQCNRSPNDDEKPNKKQIHWARAKAAEYLYSCLGGSIGVILVGGAMVNQAHVEFLSRVLPCEIYQGYGSTECGGIATANHNNDRMIPYHHMKFRVESRPDLGYTMEDKPFARGELLVLSKETAGAEDWFGDEQAVQEQRRKYSVDGYYCTGDIVEYHPDANSFRIIDRVSSLMKLPDGVFFSAHRVEAAIGDLTAHGISEFIVTTTAQGTVVLVLEKTPLAAEHVLLLEVQRRCRESFIDERCIPRRMIIDSLNSALSKEHPWKDSGCYTVSGKLIRQRINDRVRQQLIEADKKNDVNSSAASNFAISTEKDTALALFDAIGMPTDSLRAIKDVELLPLDMLGVNSLLWAKLRSVVRQYLTQRGHAGARLPFFDLSKKNMLDVACWMTETLNQSRQVTASPREATISGHATEKIATKHENFHLEEKKIAMAMDERNVNSTNCLSEDSQSAEANSLEQKRRVLFKDYAHNIDKLEAELFRLVDAEIPRPSKICKTNSSKAHRVFLTGATGFLGRHVLRLLLIDGVEVTCLVRGDSIEEAKTRVIRGFALSGWNDDSVFTRLHILVGSIAVENLGLSQRDYDLLACNTDSIVHAAAKVKMWSLDTELGDAHEMLYTNTQSCVSIARLSAYAKQFGRQSIPIVYTSTKSVENGLLDGTIVEEVGLHYSSERMWNEPYAISKLLGETILMHGRRSSQNFLCIMRPPLLTFSADGDSNDSDWFVRLLLTVMDLRLAPCQGQSEFLAKRTAFLPVDEYAHKLVKEVFKQLEERSLQPLSSTVKWADAFGVEMMPRLCIRDIIRSLEGDVELVPTYAFRSSVLFSEHPLPFLPLVDSLVDRNRAVLDEENDGTDLSLPTSGEEVEIPTRLRQGLVSFFNKHCPSITIKPRMEVT